MNLLVKTRIHDLVHPLNPDLNQEINRNPKAKTHQQQIVKKITKTKFTKEEKKVQKRKSQLAKTKRLIQRSSRLAN